MDIKIGISIFINKAAPTQKLVLPPGAIIRGNTVGTLAFYDTIHIKQQQVIVNCSLISVTSFLRFVP